MNDYDKIKKILALGFMHYLDENRPEGKACLSNGECADIEKAFNEKDWPKLMRYLDKYTESEDERMLASIIERGRAQVPPYTTALREEQIDWLVDVLTFHRLRPKQERSEYERILKGIIGKIDHDQTYGVSKDDMLNFLNKL